MPMRLDEGWNQIQFNLSDFTRRAYGESNFPECHTFPFPISLDISHLIPPQAQTTSKHSASRFTRTVEYGGFTSLIVCTRKMSFRRSSSFSFPSRFVVVVKFFFHDFWRSSLFHRNPVFMQIVELSSAMLSETAEAKAEHDTLLRAEILFTCMFSEPVY